MAPQRSSSVTATGAFNTVDQDEGEDGARHRAASQVPAKSNREGHEKPESATEKIIRARRKMQKERKDLASEAVAEIRSKLRALEIGGLDDGMSPVPTTREAIGQLEVMLDIPDEGGVSATAGSAKGSTRRVVNTGHGYQTNAQGKQVLYAKVERCHRNMIRREVWRQKFDFLYEQMQKETREVDLRQPLGLIGASASLATMPDASETVQANNGLASASLPGAGPASAGNIGGSLAGASSMGGASPTKVRRTSSTMASAAAAGRGRGEGCNTVDWGPEVAGLRPATPAGVKDSRPNSRGVSKQSKLQPRSQRGQSSSSCTRPGTGSEFSRPGTGSTRASTTRSSTPGHARPGLPSSQSLPVLLAAQQELGDVRDEYYGGDDVFMHEDILHCSNPRLFPLRPNNGKLFPLPSLAAC
eukprot:gnl/TRDRNA2_/TRDRNA2_190151_c0_seq1.p1 gnl/TRDRNA2_/TRDRNA2_190151_c0~~gnl/TRDRNA2_/TRDRNA2_190151_c0_seq1.p1  ORF type:complete len:415 (-),score=67.39 gnl/TRDRNA2_/TRDRNA2_190151_c0_seq1:427-1671(-)